MVGMARGTAGADLLITNVTVGAHPGAAMIQGCDVVERSGRIHAVRPRAENPEPVEGPVLDADGRVLAAGFWNCHVHFIDGVWSRARRSETGALQRALDDMLVSRGFTSVVDLGSNSRNTLPLIARIEAGELTGPTIHTATEPIHPARGVPFYTRESVSWFLRWALPAPRTPAGARRAARRGLRRGAHVIKLFTGSYVEPDRIKAMTSKVADAAVGEAHQQGVLVFAHPSNREGLKVALDAGVDVIAHVPDETEGTESLLLACAAQGKRLVPTLHMFAHTVTKSPTYTDPIDQALRTFWESGGRILFGTDVGYMDEYDTAGEFEALHRCGLGAPEILASLTTEPAAAFGDTSLGTVEPGMAADLTLLETRSGDIEPRHLRDIAAVVKDGRVIQGPGELSVSGPPGASR